MLGLGLGLGYKGELSFFDHYIIPLANKLKDYKVFGVSSDEYLNYAEKNRNEWKVRGVELVTKMVNEFCSMIVDQDLSQGTVYSL